QGFLVTSDGNYVLGENGRIMVGSSSFQVAYNGRVTGAEAIEDTLRIVTFEDNAVLRKQGDNLYYGYDDAQPIEDNASIIRQGFQENSNVNVANEMVELLTLYRKYEANQKAVTMNDETIGMAASKIGSL
ncbi:MAG: flagellar basal-body rod protein FlgF, partial [Oscillospiraceae bacterium]|nr:flagellar basal-body rod protein FlgF [Oscillospiraceae bacterium]